MEFIVRSKVTTEINAKPAIEVVTEGAVKTFYFETQNDIEAALDLATLIRRQAYKAGMEKVQGQIRDALGF